MVSSSKKLGPHPEPPSDLSKKSLVTIDYSSTLWRFAHVSKGALGATSDPTHRFNAPARQFAVVYFSSSIEGAFAESFLHNSAIKAITENDLKIRRLARVSIINDLQLLDLRDRGLYRINADNRLCNLEMNDYGLSQRWSLAIWNHPEKVDGIIYFARANPSRESIVLYDRAHDKIELDQFNVLQRRRLLDFRKKYGFDII